MKIQTIIVDDVDLARERVRRLLHAVDSQIEIIGDYGDANEAISGIRALAPDLVFLDVQMPEINGFEVIEKIGVENMPATIFVTAYDDFAVRAFESNALDYLLKPLEEERLRKAVARAKRFIERAAAAPEIEEKLRRLLAEVKPKPVYLHRIPIKTRRGTTLILTDEIDWIAAAGHYLELHMGAETHLLREPLSQIEQKLDPQKFARIHRSTIVNLDRVSSLTPLFHGDYLIILRDGTELNMSRTFHDDLMRRLSA